MISALTAGAIFAYNARPEPAVILVIPTPVPAATAVEYRPDGPDTKLPAMYIEPLEIPLGPRTAEAVTLHLGPSEDYVVLGTLQEGAFLKVAGRDESAEWLAVEFPPNSTFRAWLPVDGVVDIDDVEALPVEPVRFLPSLAQ